MEKTCYRCNASIAEDSPFCPACGAPQIRVSSQLEQPAPESVTVQNHQTNMPIAVPVGMGAAPRTGEIQWKAFLRAAWPIALIVGVIAYFTMFGFLVLIPGSVFIVIRLYYKRHPGLPRAGEGARMGMAMGLISFIAFAGLSLLDLAKPHVRQELVRSLQQMASRNPNPQAQQMLQSLLSNPQTFAVIIGFSFLFIMLLFLVFTAISGAVAASTLGSRNP
jgi:hypothetical protein